MHFRILLKIITILNNQASSSFEGMREYIYRRFEERNVTFGEWFLTGNCLSDQKSLVYHVIASHRVCVYISWETRREFGRPRMNKRLVNDCRKKNPRWSCFLFYIYLSGTKAFHQKKKYAELRFTTVFVCFSFSLRIDLLCFLFIGFICFLIHCFHLHISYVCTVFLCTQRARLTFPLLKHYHFFRG